ncbi:MAG: hypothetical protein ACR2J9_09775 [Gaiellales bacterium]
MLIASLMVLLGMFVRVAFVHGEAGYVGGDALIRIGWAVFLVEWIALIRAAPHRTHAIYEQRFLTLIVFAGAIAALVNQLFTVPGLDAVGAALLLAPLGRWLLHRGSLRHLLALGTLIVMLATIAFWRVEHTSFGEALYWSTTAITVGPEGPAITKTETMVLTVVLGLLGVGFFGAIIGGFISIVLQREQSALERETRAEIGADIDELEEHVEDAAEQAEVDNAMLAAKLDEVVARIAALETRLPPKDAS